MKTPTPYDPEDIESLMIHKSFDELYPEEREFVLRHVDNRTEYESMRLILTELLDPSREVEWLEPDPSIRANLLAQFAREEKGGFRIWLNTLFASLNTPSQVWYQRPAVRLSFAGIAILIAVVLVLPKDETRFAELKKEVKGLTTAPSESVEESADSILPAAPGLVTPVETTVAEESPEEPYSPMPSEKPIALAEEGASTICSSDAGVIDAKDANRPKTEWAAKQIDAETSDETTITSTESLRELNTLFTTQAGSVMAISAELTKATALVPSASASIAEVGGLLDMLYTAR